MRALGRGAVLLLLLGLAGCGGRGPALRGGPGESSSLECAPYARAVTGIQLFGPAYAWWDAAAGQYARESRPEPGSVLVFRRSGRLPDGHVSVVRQVLSPRSILVDQANWVHHRISRDEPVIDVSPGNDWTSVRVWWAPAGQMGTTVYPTYGFVAPAGGGGARIASGG